MKQNKIMLDLYNLQMSVLTEDTKNIIAKQYKIDKLYIAKHIMEQYV